MENDRSRRLSGDDDDIRWNSIKNLFGEAGNDVLYGGSGGDKQ